jgi:hypothetical protein
MNETVIDNKNTRLNETVKIEGLANPFGLGGLDTNNTSANFFLAANKKQGKTIYVRKYRHASIDQDDLIDRDAMLEDAKSDNVVGKMSI